MPLSRCRPLLQPKEKMAIHPEMSDRLRLPSKQPKALQVYSFLFYFCDVEVHSNPSTYPDACKVVFQLQTKGMSRSLQVQ